MSAPLRLRESTILKRQVIWGSRECPRTHLSIFESLAFSVAHNSVWAAYVVDALVFEFRGKTELSVHTAAHARMVEERQKGGPAAD